MNFDFLHSQLADHAESIKSLTIGISEEQARWKPDPENWSILEVINHLYDEEREDFRVRLDYILHRPNQPWPPINPKGWVTERAYNQRRLSASVQAFLEERQNSLVWLKELGKPDWNAAITVSFGKFSSGDIFAAWVAHDLLHLRQLVELHWAIILREAQPYRVEYAGEW